MAGNSGRDRDGAILAEGLQIDVPYLSVRDSLPADLWLAIRQSESDGRMVSDGSWMNC